MQLRECARPLIHYIIGDGLDTFLWSDSWHPLGPFKLKFGTRMIIDAVSIDKATLSSIMDATNWAFGLLCYLLAYNTW